MTVFVAAGQAGVVAWSLEVGVAVFFGIGVLLWLLRIIRLPRMEAPITPPEL